MAIPDSNNSWAQGHLDPWWGSAHTTLPYIHEPFNDQGSLKEWRALGYTQTRFTGDMYDMRFPSTEWLDQFGKHFSFKNLCWSVYRMIPGSVLPTHSDTYNRYKLIHGLNSTADVVRVIVYLEDWQSGHYAEMNGRPITGWRAGDWICWYNDFPHLAANVGKTDRYTLQLTGTL
jgi:hypothetical protein